MFTRSNVGDQGEYASWSKAERLEPHSPGALTVEQVRSKQPNLPAPKLDAILMQRKKDLEQATLDGPLKLFPEDQWESVLLGPGLDGPSGPHTLIAFSQETVAAVQQSLTWHSLPSEDRVPESYFVFGEGQVLVPRLPKHQPSLVGNPFRSASSLPFPPPPPWKPQYGPQTSQPQTSASMSHLPSPSHLPQQPPQQVAAPSHLSSAAPNALPSSLASQIPVSGGPPKLPSRMTQPKTQPHHQHVLSNSSAVSTATPAAAAAASGNSSRKKSSEVASSSSATGVAGPSPSDPEAPKRCADELSGYCRSWNLVHQTCCQYSHSYWSDANDPTGLSSKYRYTMTKLVPGSPEFDYIQIRFINSWIHGNSKKPSVTKIKQVSCPLLEKFFNRKQEEIAATGVKPNVTELYHGTCEANFPTLFSQGFQPPADYAPHPQCPVSGPYAGKLTSSLCRRTCRLCTSMPRHTWSMCHMFGLGIYCAIDSSKSDIYVSNKKGKKNDRTKRKMLLCSVILGEAENVKVLKKPDGMHERVSPSPGKHSIFAIGWKGQPIPAKDGFLSGCRQR